MTAKRQQIIKSARDWVDTPFMHQGRVKGAGVDCAGLVICVAHELGLSDFDANNYSPNPDGVTMKATLDAEMDSIPYKSMGVGDVLYMSFVKQPQHVAIVTQLAPLYIIHADSQSGGVVEHRLDSQWLSRVRGCYRFKGVTD